MKCVQRYLRRTHIINFYCSHADVTSTQKHDNNLWIPLHNCEHGAYNLPIKSALYSIQCRKSVADRLRGQYGQPQTDPREVMKDTESASLKSCSSKTLAKKTPSSSV
ncbi:hypothetical protein BaRGS_00004218 [Batillaria attramentaria]|uniref:Uncharacterized protein n=1 Tax=Batillaria attramentaria TaxID=370345 RepID=A0ABD0LY58_9CAEN